MLEVPREDAYDGQNPQGTASLHSSKYKDDGFSELAMPHAAG